MSDRERTKTGEYVETVTPDRVLDAVASHPDPTVTAREVGEAIGCSTDAARKKLNQLHESGDVKRKKVGGRSIVWWLDESAFARELSRKSIANQHGEDHFAENPGWADDLPDLGENA
jgi:predicted ArsR family transcriptional regulator